MGLVDEVRVMVSPVVLGDGKSLFRTAAERISLTLLETKPFRSACAPRSHSMTPS
jgi:dihydrofolate reductase